MRKILIFIFLFFGFLLPTQASDSLVASFGTGATKDFRVYHGYAGINDGLGFFINLNNGLRLSNGVNLFDLSPQSGIIKDYFSIFDFLGKTAIVIREHAEGYSARQTQVIYYDAIAGTYQKFLTYSGTYGNTYPPIFGYKNGKLNIRVRYNNSSTYYYCYVIDFNNNTANQIGITENCSTYFEPGINLNHQVQEQYFKILDDNSMYTHSSVGNGIVREYREDDALLTQTFPLPENSGIFTYNFSFWGIGDFIFTLNNALYEYITGSEEIRLLNDDFYHLYIASDGTTSDFIGVDLGDKPYITSPVVNNFSHNKVLVSVYKNSSGEYRTSYIDENGDFYISTDPLVYSIEYEEPGGGGGTSGSGGTSGTGSVYDDTYIWDIDGDGTIGWSETISGVGHSIYSFFAGIGDFFSNFGDFFANIAKIGNPDTLNPFGFLLPLQANASNDLTESLANFEWQEGAITTQLFEFFKYFFVFLFLIGIIILFFHKN